jgi:hypothetical protein
VWGAVYSPPVAQDLQEPRREHHVAIAPALPLLDAQDHPLAIEGWMSTGLLSDDLGHDERTGGRRPMDNSLAVWHHDELETHPTQDGLKANQEPKIT